MSSVGFATNFAGRVRLDSGRAVICRDQPRHACDDQPRCLGSRARSVIVGRHRNAGAGVSGAGKPASTPFANEVAERVLFLDKGRILEQARPRRC